MDKPKPIKYVPLPASATPFIACDRCGVDCSEDWSSVVRFEEVDKGDYIERRDVENICGACDKKERD